MRFCLALPVPNCCAVEPGFPGAWDSESAKVKAGLSSRSSPTRVTASHLNVPMKKWFFLATSVEQPAIAA